MKKSFVSSLSMKTSGSAGTVRFYYFRSKQEAFVEPCKGFCLRCIIMNSMISSYLLLALTLEHFLSQSWNGWLSISYSICNFPTQICINE
jgi:hypothetical protein